MTYTFKLARRIARLRAPLLATLLALTACDGDKSLEPDLTGSTDHPGAASFSGGIPFGAFALPAEKFGSRFNGAQRIIYPNQLLGELAAIKARGGRVAVRLSYGDRYIKDASGNFSLTKWKAVVGQYRTVNFNSYIADGTIIGHYLIDEPQDEANWKGHQISPATVEEMARYSKELWPNMATIVRTWPDYLDDYNGTFRHLDAAWAQYAANRWPDARKFLDENVAKARAKGLALIVGLNLLDGSPSKGEMTPSQVASYGEALLSSTYPCAFISWKYDDRHQASGSMEDAMDKLRRMAENRSAKTCWGGATSGGGNNPPPSEPPPSEPPPSEPPPPSPGAGVPFGPYGLPTAEINSFSGSVRGATPSTVLGIAAAARQAGSRVVLRLTTDEVADANGRFSLTKWKSAVDKYAGVDLSSYVRDGTIAGHLLVANPQSANVWGGRAIPLATLEEMAKYSRQRWSGMPTIVQASPSWLAGRSWQYLDAASVIYSSSAGDAGTWVNKQANDAAKAKLGLLVGMNVLNGGTSASGLRGEKSGTWAMSASQLRSWGSAMLGQTRMCGLLLSRYDEGYFSRSDVRDAVRALADKASSHAGGSCRKR